MTDRERLLTGLCYADPRNPMYADIYGWMEEDDKPRMGERCSCDNCFYGLNALSLIGLKLMGEA